MMAEDKTRKNLDTKQKDQYSIRRFNQKEVIKWKRFFIRWYKV